MMTTETKSALRLRELFERGCDLSSEEQEQFVNRECNGDPALRKELTQLLAVDAIDVDEPIDPMQLAIQTALRVTTLSRPHNDLSGTLLGSYKLLSILGVGGAGVVYLAERADRRYSAQVAIKIVEGAYLYDDLGRRFATEQQILASLDHPNIARLIDAGETAQHTPYLVMEYVHGETIDTYCDEHCLSLRARLALFLKVCSAVQYAHQSLVVHRDLKPANILVTDSGEPKLLDFGIAKLLAVSPPATITRLNDSALTPDYASPEQIAGRPITTASDVYALGVVLYELLAGIPPYRVSASSNLERERLVCAVDPPRPSSAIRRLVHHTDASERQLAFEAARARGLQTSRLSEALSGDLDAITMRALRKEPDKRYPSVEQLIADIQRYLTSEPVHARNGNWMYYSERFVRRHIVSLGLGSLVAIALVTGILISTTQYHIARQQRDRATQAQQAAERARRVAEQVSGFLDAAFSHVDPYTAKGHEVSAQELIDSASLQLSNVDEPEVRARLLKQFGHAYHRLGQYQKAVMELRNAVDIERPLYEHTDPTRVALTLTQLAVAERANGEFAQSETDFHEVVRIMEAQQHQHSAAYADLLREMGRLEHTRGEVALAEQYYTRSIELQRSLKEVKQTDLALTMSELALVYMWKGDLNSAERAARDALNIFELTVPPLNPDRIFVQRTLGDVLYQQGRVDAAAELMEKALTAQRTVYLNAGPQLAQSLEMLAWVRVAQKRLDDAELLLREALENARRFLGVEHYETGYYLTSLAAVQYQRQRYGDADHHAREALAILQKTLPLDHPYIASAEHWLGEILLKEDKPLQAKEMLEAAVTAWDHSKSAPWLAARSESALGEALVASGNRAAGLRRLKDAYLMLRQTRGPNDVDTQTTLSRLNQGLGVSGLQTQSPNRT